MMIAKEVIIIIAMFISVPNIVAQDFFPLEVGNEWQYNLFNEASQIIDTTYTIIISDTTIDNREYYNFKNFLIFESVSFRAEGNKIYLWDCDEEYDALLFDFDLEVYEYIDISVWPWSSLVCLEEYYENVFGEQSKIKVFKLDGLAGLTYLHFSKEKGLLIEQKYGEPPTTPISTNYLFGCKISGVIYGDYYLDVTQIETVAENYRLEQNYPNPFSANGGETGNTTTIIRFSISKNVSNVHCQLTIYNALGQQVAELINKPLTIGNYEVKFRADNLPSGIYFYRLQSGTFTETKKMILLK